MLNGQLKPAYNIQHGVDSEYSTWIDISSHPTDTRTLIPFLKDMENHLGFKYSEVVADAGYESEENYLFIEENGQTVLFSSSRLFFYPYLSIFFTALLPLPVHFLLLHPLCSAQTLLLFLFRFLFPPLLHLRSFRHLLRLRCFLCCLPP